MPPRAIPDQQRLVQLVDAFVDRPVLMVVDLVADRFITGSPKRISREAPVLILSKESDVLVPGGGANAALNVWALGGRPLPVGVVGDDENGRELVASLSQHGIDVGGILHRKGYATACKTRVLGGSRHSIKQQIVRFDVEEKQALADDERHTLEAAIADRADGCQVAVLSDYGLGTVDPAFVEAVKRQGEMLCLADSRHRLADFVGLDGATPNEEELESIEGPVGENAAAAARRLRERLDSRFLLLTRGSEGMVLVDDEGALEIPCHGSRQVADVTGAGDTVIGTFALATAAGATPTEAALLANYAGGEVVMKMGTASVDAEELRAAIRSDDTPLKELEWAAW